MLHCNLKAEFMAKSSGEGAGPVTIKKYANRRLYNTETSSYITLDNLATMVREGREFKVVDAKSKDDITRSVLAQIIMDEESKGTTMLPAGFLRQLIGMYGNSMQALVPQYLEASMEAFQKNQAQFRTVLEGALAGSPFEELHKRNMAMLDAATSVLRPGAKKPDAKDDEITALKAELAALQSKIENLS
jgi:polyhydroxyalkanoate synthesis repressor PhaR